MVTNDAHLTNTANPWDHEAIVGHLARLDTGARAVIWTEAAGLVRVRCYRAGRLWEFSPVAGNWLWLMVGANQVTGGLLWTVGYSDGFHAPERLRVTNLGAQCAIWDAVAFLAYDIETDEERAAWWRTVA